MSHENNDMHIANSVSITFVMTKNGERMERTTNEKKTGDRILNPIKRCAVIVRRLRLHPKSMNSKKMYSHATATNDLVSFPQTQVLQCMCQVASLIEDKLSLSKNEIGAHSIRTSATMGWYLEKNILQG